MSPEELCEIGRQAQAPDWPKGTRQATKDAFEAGKEAALAAILDTLQRKGSLVFWEVRPKPFSPPAWTIEE